MVKSFLTKSPSETKKLAEILAKKILGTSLAKKPFILTLEGDLGSGKTTFLQGFARGLGIREKILSPSFIIMRKFEIQKPKSKYKNFYHIDCYRLKKPKEVLDLGLKEIIKNPQNIVVIEWGDKIKKILPKNILLLKFDFINQGKRKITIISKVKSFKF